MQASPALPIRPHLIEAQADAARIMNWGPRGLRSRAAHLEAMVSACPAMADDLRRRAAEARAAARLMQFGG